VLKTSDLGENNKILTIFTDKIGKISTVAKGAKKSKSKFLSLTQPLCYGEYMVFRGKNLYTLNEGKIIDSFQELLGDLTTLTYASYLCELVDISMQQDESNRELFKEFVTALYLIKTKAIDNELLIRAFELKLMRLTGYTINFENCSLCRKKIVNSNYISLQYYGGVCDDCNKEHGMHISRATFNALKFLNNITLDKVYRLNLSKEIKEELYKINISLIANNYSRKPKSLQMFDFIKESEGNE
jgi:DNA repair protein RecO (recombination protein O)